MKILIISLIFLFKFFKDLEMLTNRLGSYRHGEIPTELPLFFLHLTNFILTNKQRSCSTLPQISTNSLLGVIP